MNPQDKYAHIKRIFTAARKLPQEEQKAFVLQQAEGDETVANEVLSMLENDVEDTLLAKDKISDTKVVIDPLGLKKYSAQTKENALSKVLFSSRGRAGLAFFIIAVFIAIAGYLASLEIKQTLAEIRAEETSAILSSNVEALESWIDFYRDATEMAAYDPEINKVLVAMHKVGADTILGTELDRLLQPFLAHNDAHLYIVTDLAGNIICSPQMALAGKRVGVRFGNKIMELGDGNSQFVHPFYAGNLADSHSHLSDIPLVWMQVPVLDSAQNVVATFGIGRKASQEFTQIIQTARMGKTGETYAIDKEGWFLSRSRFEDVLRQKKMLPADTSVTSVLHFRAQQSNYKLSQDILPLTELAAMVANSANANSAINSGALMEPTEDYKGEQVIGAWAWLPKYGFGMISQIQADEAFAPIKYLFFFVALVVMLLLIASAFSFYQATNLHKIRHAMQSVAQLGQYELIRLIAEGGMGTVYFAKHKLLKRPTAIKVIKSQDIDKSMTTRFEREVKLASQLSNPNTIDIFDYGITSQGMAYYAMEYVDGVSLAQVVKFSGALPPARVIHILKQVCGSLYEAHTLGLVHRDIKPQNIMITNRIGLPDFVKVLDFGLVKPLGGNSNTEETHAITGTPVYISPERLKQPALAEPSSDIYSVGAVAYYLLSGHSLFRYSSDLDVLYQVLNEPPNPLPDHIPEELRKLTFLCLEKQPEDRLGDIGELKLFLDQLSVKFPWQAEDAALWWEKYNA